ncbi:hypothetical protein EIMP300_03110 [Escherichia coli]|uniref:ACT domain-containing protein n=1 Tax=Escherichia coli TaxID=562 RepID=A0A8S0FEX5_ECOLX|nr:hypothetical protein EIMP300_03110 [Escherichia coli]
MHPATLLPAVRSDIPVFVGSSKDPRAGGTLVCNKTENPPLFRALALRRNQTLLTLHSLNMLHSRGFLAEVFGILARHNISVDLITTSEVSVALTLDTTGSTSTGDTLLTQSLLMELSALCRVEVEEGLALVALIGNDLSKACGVGKEVFGVLEPFNIRMICYGREGLHPAITCASWCPAKMPSRWCRSYILICLSKHSMARKTLFRAVLFFLSLCP